jgi:diguanylate cyclase (GGDEF)-like protein
MYYEKEISDNEPFTKVLTNYIIITLFFSIPVIFLYFNFFGATYLNNSEYFFISKNYYFFYTIFLLFIPLIFLIQKNYSYFFTAILVSLNIISWIVFGILTFFKHFADVKTDEINLLQGYDFAITLLLGITGIIIFTLLAYKFFDKIENKEIRYKINIENLKLKTAMLNNTAIEKREKMNGYKELIKKFNMLNKISEKVLTETKADKIIKLLLSKISELFKPDNFFILINKKSGLNIDKEIYLEYKYLNKEILNSIKKHFQQNLSPLFIENLKEDLQFNQFNNKTDFNGFIVVPLLHKNTLLGNIGIFYNEIQKIEPYHLRLLNYISNIFSVSICSAFLYSETEKKAQKDGLTGLYKRWFFEEDLQKELIIAKRYNKKLSLIMIDIDYFKKFNDTYGHASGDMIIRKISEIFLKSINKPIDLACRWGGEEFIIMLPSKEKKEALLKAEELRTHIESNLKISEIQETITASFGVSTFPEDAETMDDLIIFADKMLYKSKTEGRNRVN